MSDIQAIKYRLVGAVVIVAGFAAIWWLMLDHEAHRRIKDEQVELPRQTFPIKRFDIEQPEPLGIRTPAETAAKPRAEPIASVQSEHIKPDEVKTVIANAPEVAAPKPLLVEPKTLPIATEAARPVAEKPVPASVKTDSYAVLDKDGLPEAWVLQLASLKSKENAQQLQRKLLASSYPAYVKSVNTADGISYRVLVGPKLSRQKAEELSRAIEREHRIKSMIIRFQSGYEQ